MNRVLIQQSWQLLMMLEQRLKATRDQEQMQQRILQLWKYAWRRYERRVQALIVNAKLTAAQPRNEQRPPGSVALVGA